MDRKRVAVVQPVMVPGGGTEAVTAWAIEALKKDYQVTLVTFSKVDANTLNDYYGTALREEEYSVARPYLLPLLRGTKRFAILKDHLMMRYCKSLRSSFDLFFSVGGHMDFGTPGMQYLAYAPGSTLIKVLNHDPTLPSWYYLFKKSFMGLCQLVSGYSADTVQQNVTLLTSKWTGKEIGRAYSFPKTEVVYPPVDTVPAGTSWDMRQEGFLCIARIVPEKLIEDAIEILKRTREKGFDVSLHIIGRPDDPEYFRRIEKLRDDNSSWVVLHGVLPKKKLFKMMDQHKYGINPSLGEPSGVAALEMVKAGCIVFVRGGGGLPEIIDTPEVTYDDIEDGVAKITELLTDHELQKRVLNQLGDRGESFSTQAFSDAMKRVVSEFFNER